MELKKSDIINTNFILGTAGCINKCVFCGGSKKKDSAKSIEFEFNKLKKIAKENDNILSVEISGNDPGEYQDLPEIIKKIKKITKCNELMLSTHGQTLKDENFLVHLIEAGLTKLRIPIYGHNAKIHDSITKYDGSFQELMAAFNNINKYKDKIEIQITTIFLKENQYNLKELIYFMSKMDFATHYSISLAGFVPEKKFFIQSIPNFDDLKKVLPEIIDYVKQKKMNVGYFHFTNCLAENIEITEFVTPFRGYTHFGLMNLDKPSYLQNIKTKECEKCDYLNTCPGFLKTYVENGYFKPKAINKIKN